MNKTSPCWGGVLDLYSYTYSKIGTFSTSRFFFLRKFTFGFLVSSNGNYNIIHVEFNRERTKPEDDFDVSPVNKAPEEIILLQRKVCGCDEKTSGSVIASVFSVLRV